MDSATLPSDVTQWFSAFQRQIRFYFRTMRFVGLLGFVTLVSVAATAVAIVYGSSATSASDYLYGILGNLPTFGIIVGAFIGGDAIAMDSGGTGYFTLVLPVRRLVLLLGRYAAAFLVSFVLLLVFYAFSIFGAAWLFGAGSIPWADVGVSVGFAALFALATLATAFLFSAFFRSPAVSMVVTILVLFLAFLFIDGLLVLTTVEPWFSLLYAGEIMALVFEGQPHLTSTTLNGPRHLTITTYHPFLWEGAVILLVYLVVSLVLSAVLFQYRELKG